MNSEFLRHEPCPKCGSKDNLGRFSDGHGHCFGCGHYEHGEGTPKPTERTPKVTGLIPIGEAVALPARGLTQKTCERWSYTVTKLKGQTVQVANYRGPDGQVIFQQVRTKDKEFPVFGNFKEAGLGGQHLCREGGRRIIITEGWIDAMSVDQVLDYKWQVVSLKGGAQGARKELAAQLQFLNSYEQIVLCFDMDDPGRKAVEDCISLFKPGKAFTVHLPRKDANEMLQEGQVGELVNALWSAKPYRPDGLVTVADVKQSVLVPLAKDLRWVWPGLDAATYGRRFGELVGLGAGTGVGKTTLMFQQVIDDLKNGHGVGVFAFESAPKKTVRRLAGQLVGQVFHRPGDWTMQELSDAVDLLEVTGELHLHDHWGSADWDNVKERIRFLRHHHGVRVFYIDHLTAFSTGSDDERKLLEKLTGEVAGLCQELDAWIMFVSHLNTPDGTPHEEGGRVMIKHLKGSRAIGFWAYDIFGLERNQQDPEEGEVTTLRILKNREMGNTGMTFRLAYERATDRLLEAIDDHFSKPENDHDRRSKDYSPF